LNFAVSIFLDPGRGRRPGYGLGNDQLGGGGGGADGSWQGPKTDFGINPWLNDPNGNYSTSDNGQTLERISNLKGTSNVVLFGERALCFEHYACGSGFWDETILFGGTGGTARTSTEHPLKDQSKAEMGTSYANRWGSPYPAWICIMCDTSIRAVP